MKFKGPKLKFKVLSIEESVEDIILDLYNGFQAEIKASVKWLD